LRRSEGIAYRTDSQKIGGLTVDKKLFDAWLDRANRHAQQGWLQIGSSSLVLTRQGKLFADGIAASLFL
jgi:coproporphyrinogen III oxidase-like Fe-S oxidoreductase